MPPTADPVRNIIMQPSRHCPVCDASPKQATTFFEENIDPRKLNTFSFASRKEPEFMNHRLVRCTRCDLVFVDRPPAESELAHAYHTAAYDSAEEADDAAAAYINAIAPTLRRLTRRGSALEIGTGTGIFLEHLKRAGFTNLAGVEPSTAAINAAPAHRKAWIREAMFNEADYPAASFDLVCCFMTMEHVRSPGEIAQAASRLLRPGGAFVTVTHNYRSLVNKAMGRRSPIIDIEHMQLFSPASIRYLFESRNYVDVTVDAFVNRYAWQYWMRLMPLPSQLKRTANAMLGRTGLGHLKIGLNVGNMLTAGFKGSA